MLLEVFLLAIAILLMIPALMFFVEVLAAFFLPVKSAIANDIAPTIAVLIPAHNESKGMIETLASIKSQLTAHDRLLVVADNCSDDTAEVAKNNGAEVIERQDVSRRGKGYALDFGIQFLANNPREILVIVDADCIVEQGGLKKIAIHCEQHQKPVQALYLMYNKTEGSLKSKVAEFAWTVKNWVRPLGCLKLGMPCQLMGTGMAFPWQSIKNVDLANGNIVEDMKLGVDFAIANQAPIFFPDTKVWSFFPTVTDVQQGQSKRWEHGHMAMILSEAPAMIAKAICTGNIPLFMMAIDLAIPPLALLVGLVAGVALLNFVAMINFGMAENGFYVIFTSFIMLFIAVLIAWLGWGRKILSLSSMLFIPIYILLKIPNYFGFIFKRQSSWNKTKREHE
jgi:cellulose synthase/poly-beta-1,6-N-acetylglucosamine synthase-like glycosyltransferase